jgi:hypothetical protein
MHTVAEIVAALAAQASHLIAFIPANVIPPPW